MSRGARVTRGNHQGTHCNRWISCHVNSGQNVTWNIADENIQLIGAIQDLLVGDEGLEPSTR